MFNIGHILFYLPQTRFMFGVSGATHIYPLAQLDHLSELLRYLGIEGLVHFIAVAEPPEGFASNVDENASCSRANCGVRQPIHHHAPPPGMNSFIMCSKTEYGVAVTPQASRI